MKKMQKRGEKWIGGLAVLFVAFVTLAPAATADQGAPGAGGGGEGKLTRAINKIKNPFSGSGLGDLFGDQSAADVGHKPRIRPHFAFVQGFNSNARLGNRQVDEAWQARMAPGITLSIPSGKLYTEVDYTYAFTTTQGRRTHDNTNTHNLNAIARYDLSADTTVGVGNNFQISDVPGTSGDTFTLNTTTAQVRHRLSPKLNASLGDAVQWFNDSGTSRQHDFIDNGVSAGLTYDATSDLSVGPTFAWNVRDFRHISEKNYWQIQPGIGASYRLGPKTTLGGNFGWAYRRFEKGSNNESELVYGVTASHMLGRKFIWSLAYAKTLTDTFDTGFVFRELPQAVALDNLDRDFRVLKSHRIGTAATYNFNERNSLGAFGDFQFINADAKDRVGGAGGAQDEKAMEVGARYTYRLNRYLSLDVAYSFGRRFDGQGNPQEGRADRYTFHKVTGGVNIAV